MNGSLRTCTLVKVQSGRADEQWHRAMGCFVELGEWDDQNVHPLYRTLVDSTRQAKTSSRSNSISLPSTHSACDFDPILTNTNTGNNEDRQIWYRQSSRTITPAT